MLVKFEQYRKAQPTGILSFLGIKRVNFEIILKNFWRHFEIVSVAETIV